MPRAYITAITTALPDRIVTNQELADENPDWRYDQLFPKTGVAERRVAAPDETTLDLSVTACEALFAKADVTPAQIDTLVVCTQTPDYLMPGNSALLQHRLGLAEGTRCLDISHACSGYVQGLELIQAFIASGASTTALLVTGDTYSKLIAAGDRSVRSLFGDGVTASLITARDDAGVLDIASGTDGRNYKHFYVEAGGFREDPDAARSRDTAPTISMNGMGVLSYFTRRISAETQSFLAKNGMGLDDIDSFVFHQASSLALNNLIRSLRLPEDKVVRAFEDTGNLTSASIPAALERAMDSGQVRPGQTVLLCGFGVGLAWGFALLKT